MSFIYNFLKDVFCAALRTKVVNLDFQNAQLKKENTEIKAELLTLQVELDRIKAEINKPTGNNGSMI